MWIAIPRLARGCGPRCEIARSSGQGGTHLLGVQPSRRIFLLFQLSIAVSMTFAGLKLGGNERGGKCLNVDTNWKASSITPYVFWTVELPSPESAALLIRVLIRPVRPALARVSSALR